jgi:hypothetical protein
MKILEALKAEVQTLETGSKARLLHFLNTAEAEILRHKIAVGLLCAVAFFILGLLAGS